MGAQQEKALAQIVPGSKVFHFFVDWQKSFGVRYVNEKNLNLGGRLAARWAVKHGLMVEWVGFSGRSYAVSAKDLADGSRFKEFVQALQVFAEAGSRLLDAWYALKGAEEDLAAKGYPEYMPSFDDFVLGVWQWYREVKKHVN